jgi:hypothetical protein
VLLGDGECLEEMRELVRDLKLEPWVSMTAWLSEADVFGCLAAADLGIDMSLQSEVSLPDRVAGSALISVARETSEYWAHALWTNRWPSIELHVLLDGLEGMLILAGKRDGHGLLLVERSFARLMEETQAPDSTLPETISGVMVRSDVLARRFASACCCMDAGSSGRPSGVTGCIGWPMRSWATCGRMEASSPRTTTRSRIPGARYSPFRRCT